MVLKNLCVPSRHLPRFSTISWGGPSCTSLVICCGPYCHFPGFSTISWAEDLVQALWFCWSIFFARLLVEVQFLGYKFGFKGSTYTWENTVCAKYLVNWMNAVECAGPIAPPPSPMSCVTFLGVCLLGLRKRFSTVEPNNCILILLTPRNSVFGW